MCMVEVAGMAASIPVLIGAYYKLITPKKIKYFNPFSRPKTMVIRELEPHLISHIHEIGKTERSYYFYKGAKTMFRYGNEGDFEVFATPISVKRMERYRLQEIKKFKDCHECSENSTGSGYDGR